MSSVASTSASNHPLFSGLSPQLPTLANAEPTKIALDAFKLAGAMHVAKHFDLDLAFAFNSVEIGSKDRDLNIPVPKLRIKGDAKKMAQELAASFEPNDYLESAAANGINVTWTFRLSTLSKLVLNQVNELTHLSEKPSYGTNTLGGQQHVIMEYSSPNIAKPFHAGHLRSTIIGATLSNIYEANGWKVTRINYLGDWGKQFGVLAVGFAKYGNEEDLAKDAITHLYNVYVKINADANKEDAEWVQKTRAERREKGEENVPAEGADPTAEEKKESNAASSIHGAAREIFERMEAGDKDALAIWTRFRDLSIVKYKEIYARLNIEFDIYSGESQVSIKSQTDAVKALRDSGLATQDNGAIIIDLEKYKLGKTVLQKRDGTTIYVSRDIGGAAERYEKFKFDKMVYVVASQQELHFQQLFKILDLMGYEWAPKCQHISFGMIQGMSTRKGTSVFLEQILDEAKDTMHEQMQKTADKYAQIEDPIYTSDVLGMSAVKIQDMSAKRINNYNFDWARMTNFLGDTGPYLQYAHVRVSSIVRKAGPDVVLPPADQIASKVDTSLLTEQKAREVLIILAAYPDAVKNALRVQEPSSIVNWCWKLTHAVSSAYEVLIVKGQPEDIAVARLLLYVSAKDALAGAMRLLTLTPLERM